MTLATFQKRIAGLGNHIAWSSKDVARIAERMGVNAATASFAVMAAERSVPSAPSVGTVSKSTGDDREYTFTISTAAIDRIGDSIDQKGWKLSEYRRNPVVLWSHAASLLPVGKATAVWIQGGKLKASMKFAPGAEAAMVRALVEDGTLRATSVGFQPLKWSFSDDAKRQYGIDFHEQNLLEFSVVSVPANPEALIDGGQIGNSGAAKRLRDLALVRLRAS